MWHHLINQGCGLTTPMARPVLRCLLWQQCPRVYQGTQCECIFLAHIRKINVSTYPKILDCFFHLPVELFMWCQCAQKHSLRGFMGPPMHRLDPLHSTCSFSNTTAYNASSWIGQISLLCELVKQCINAYLWEVQLYIDGFHGVRLHFRRERGSVFSAAVCKI